jgi:hypothetical protein
LQRNNADWSSSGSDEEEGKQQDTGRKDGWMDGWRNGWMEEDDGWREG